MSLPANHADGPSTAEVVHLADRPLADVQRCGRCGIVIVDNRPFMRGVPGKVFATYFLDGETVVGYEGTAWACVRKPTCEVNGGR